MAKNVELTLWSSLRETFADLAPFPGRLATSWRVAAVCALVAGIAMMFNIPESAISCYLVIFLMKADGAENTVVGTAAIFAISLLVVLMIPIVQWTVESALLRILVMILVSVVFIFIGAATKLGEGGSIVALIIAFLLTLVNEVPINGVISFGLRFAWEMAILPMFVIAGFCLFFGRWSVTLLREEMQERLMLARDILLRERAKDDPALLERLENGNDDANQRAMLTRVLHQTSASKADKISRDIPASYQLLYAVSALPDDVPEANRQHYAKAVEAMLAALKHDEPFPACTPAPEPAQSGQEICLNEALHNLTGIAKTDYVKSAADRFLAADAFTNPVYQRFALKTTLAAILSYMFYASINWQGIHTAMVTCYVASMGTAGDTIHKLALRIGGCLVGAAIGIASLIYLMPYMVNVASLMLLVFVVALFAAWVAAGTEKISYAGVQIGLAFTLTVLQGFGPSTELSPAWDRIVGILVGNFAVYLVSTLIWPTPVVTTICQHLAEAAEKIAEMVRAEPAERSRLIARAAEVEHLLGEVRYCLYLLPFEPKALRPPENMVKAFQSISRQLASLSKDVYFSSEKLDNLNMRLLSVSQHIQSFALAGNNVPANQTDTAHRDANAGDMEIVKRLGRLETLVAGSRA
ncbi:FUSC family protein [Daeguia caeni]|uniref:FUSC family protein n=1 Tax=Daeguia caeni TaxID=439612 RepID=A0ABV9H673_9HYPH